MNLFKFLLKATVIGFSGILLLQSIVTVMIYNKSKASNKSNEQKWERASMFLLGFGVGVILDYGLSIFETLEDVGSKKFRKFVLMASIVALTLVIGGIGGYNLNRYMSILKNKSDPAAVEKAAIGAEGVALATVGVGAGVLFAIIIKILGEFLSCVPVANIILEEIVAFIL